MDYSRKGVIAKRRRLNSYSGKIVRKIILLGFKLFLAGVLGVGICLLAGGIGLFNSILAGTLTVRLLSCMMRWAMSSTTMSDVMRTV